MPIHKHSPKNFFCHGTLAQLILFMVIIFFFTPFAQTSSAPGPKKTQDTELVKKASYYRSLGYELLPRYPEGWVIRTGKYVAIDDVAISRGQAAIIESGTSIYFEAGKRILIDGKLQSKGTLRKQVLLTNVPFNQSYIPISVADSLWGGIEVGVAGVVDFEHTAILNARKGIAATGKPDSIKLNCVDIKNVLGVRLSSGLNSIVLLDTTCLIFPRIIDIKKDLTIANPNWDPTRTLAISTGILLGGTIAAAVLTAIYYNKAKDGSNPNQVNPDGDLAKSSYYAAQIFGGGTLIAFSATSISFIINQKSEKKLR